MCFSAEVSFAASAALGACGVIGIKKAASGPQKAFATIPLFFGVQQFMEGLLWLALSEPIYAGWTNIATHTFLFFAWVIWPVYVPLSVRLLEKRKKRKAALTIFLVIGVVASSLLGFALIFYNVQAQKYGHHIRYTLEFEFQYHFIIGIFYFIPIVISLFVSSVKRMWLLGIMVLLSFLTTLLFYREHLISVWCFFAAATSIMVLWMVYQMPKARQTKAEPSDVEQE